MIKKHHEIERARCNTCGKSVRLTDDEYLVTHVSLNGRTCNGSGRHKSFVIIAKKEW